jgi:glycosyltransferase involved in cell wall biosynthesis
MIFILYSDINAQSIDQSLGLPEYSYYFVLKGFQEALEKLGEVILVTDPATEVDKIYQDHNCQNCVFLSCSPPHRTLTTLDCPTISVFAWEFSNIPNEVWDNEERNDWRRVLKKHGRTIPLSSDACRAVKEAMGEDFPAVAIPVPIWDQFDRARQLAPELKTLASRSISFTGQIIDSKSFDEQSGEFSSGKLPKSIWQGDDIRLNFSYMVSGRSLQQSNMNTLKGFYAAEEWGAWSRTARPAILLPQAISGDIEVTLELLATGSNIDREIDIQLGKQKFSVRLSDQLKEIRKSLSVEQPFGEVSFGNLDLNIHPDSQDPRTMAIGIKSLSITQPKDDLSRRVDLFLSASQINNAEEELWVDHQLDMHFNNSSQHPLLLKGFYPSEDWGTWSESNSPSIALPAKLCGNYELSVDLHGYGENIFREITLQIGANIFDIKLTEEFELHSFPLVLEPAIKEIFFANILPATPCEGDSDRRNLGIAIRSLSLKSVDKGHVGTVKLERSPQKIEDGELSRLDVNGVVYTSIFNPSDGRKNWIDIVTAFCWALRDKEDATLVLKMTTKESNNFLGTFHLLLSQLAPFKCRVVAIQGFLDDHEYENLILASTYYINASHCEGLCLPLMEYMACGTPAIAPDNTAMADYINDGNAFVVSCSKEQNVWPHDPRDVFRTLRYRINWESLMDNCKLSYQTAKEDPEKYQQMAKNAENKISSYASVEAVTNKLSAFFSEELTARS